MNNSPLVQKASLLRHNLIEMLSDQYGLPHQMIEQISINLDDIYALYEIIKNEKYSRVLEVGSFVGISTSILHLLTKCDIIVSIDPRLSLAADVAKYRTSCFDSNELFFDIVCKKSGVEKSLVKINGFFATLPHDKTIKFHEEFNLNIKSIPIVGKKAFKYGPFDIIFIDADHHSTSVTSDLILAAKMISNSGKIILHDCVGKWKEEVQQGITQFLSITPKNFTFEIIKTIGVLSH